MTQYLFESPDMQLDTSDCLAIKNALETVSGGGSGFVCHGPNISLQPADLIKLDAAIDGNTKVDASNIQLTAAEIASLKPHVT